MTIAEIKRVCFVGAGTMGCYNAITAALAGYEAVLFDASADSLANAPHTQLAIGAYLVSSKHCSQANLDAALQRISVQPDMAKAVANVQLVSESVFERLDVKRDVHAQLDAVCAPATILTTNSSGLLVSDIESAVQRGDKFAALHSHLGAPLIDIVAGPRTSASVVDCLKRYVLSINGHPLVLKREHPGYVLNAMIGHLLGTAVGLAMNGVATVHDIDRAWMVHKRAPMGPFGMMDLFGLDVVCDGFQHNRSASDALGQRARMADFLQPFVQRTHLGKKTGQGFYTYPNPAFEQHDFLSAEVDLSVANAALTASVIHTASMIALKDVVAPEQVNEAWKVGMRLDAGPFDMVDAMGLPVTLHLLEQVKAMFTVTELDAVVAYLTQRGAPTVGASL